MGACARAACREAALNHHHPLASATLQDLQGSLASTKWRSVVLRPMLLLSLHSCTHCQKDRHAC